MEVNDHLVNKLAHLSRLQFSETEKDEIKKDLQQMIDFVEKLKELNLDHVTPLLYISEEINVCREDKATATINRDEALRNAPVHNDEYFIVPRVIGKTLFS